MTISNTQPRFTKLAIAAAILTSILAGCGGGGGGTSSTPSIPAPAIPNPGNLITVAPTGNYAPGSAEAEVFAEINAVRVSGGFGGMRQNANLDKAAAAHLNYYFNKWHTVPAQAFEEGTFNPLYDAMGNPVMRLAVNNAAIQASAQYPGTLNAHIEVAGELGHTGDTSSQRAQAAGFGNPSSVGEVIGYGSRGPAYALPQDGTCIASLLAGPFHRSALLNPASNEVGIAMMAVDSKAANRTCVINMGYLGTGGQTPDGWVGIYPADKSTGLPAVVNEAPNPWPEYTKGIGTSPSVFVGSDSTISVTSFTISGPDGKPLDATVLTVANDKYNGTYMSRNQAFLLPNGMLQSETTYTVNFVGKAVKPGSETPINRTWSFTTKKYCAVGAVCKA